MKLRIIGLALSLSLVLTACGGEGDGGGRASFLGRAAGISEEETLLTVDGRAVPGWRYLYWLAAACDQLAEEYRQLWEILCGGLEQCARILGDTPVELQEFSQLLKLVLSQYDVGTIPVSLDQVTAGDAARLAPGGNHFPGADRRAAHRGLVDELSAADTGADLLGGRMEKTLQESKERQV